MTNRPLFLALASLICAIPLVARAQDDGARGGAPGAYSRLGIGARGLALGNALVAGTADGMASALYNPALLPLASSRSVSASGGLLTLDRRLNVLQINLPLRGRRAGVAFGLINAGVRHIDGRDSDGRATGDLSTGENLISFAFGVAPRPDLSFGVVFRGYQASLYDGVKQNFSVGLDVGASYRPAQVPGLTVAAAMSDANSSYRWNTKPIYGEKGTDTEDHFPLRFRLGARYTKPYGSAMVELEQASRTVDLRTADFTDAGVLINRSESRTRRYGTARFGLEATPTPLVAVRAGIDEVGLTGKTGVRPTLGFGIEIPGTGRFRPRLDYAVAFEPNAPGALHLIEASFRF